MRRFVLDTSVFVNPASTEGFARNSKAAVKKLATLLKKSKAEVYISPSIYKEMSHFLDNLDELSPYVRIKAPNLYSTYVPAAIIYSFIEDFRGRINKGLRIAEEFAKKEKASSQDIKSLREKYREALRTGIVDSKEDFEAVILCKELDAAIVTADEGIVKLARELGCEHMEPSIFYKIVKEIR
ncbi:MAG: RNA ligase partner protein [Methanobacteriota archaeon]|nr:MAG: RNA ligase partner protein [Euryarchaeota archaeon]